MPVNRAVGLVAEKPGAALIFRKRLIDGEVHFAAFDDLAGFDFVTGVAEGTERLVLGVIDEDVAIREKENARLAVPTGSVPAA